MAVLLENLGHDNIFDYTIELDGSWTLESLYGGEGTLAADRRSIRMTSDLPPGAALVLKLKKA